MGRSDLQVVLGVPVRVEDDACVGGCEVDAQPSGPGTQQEDEAVRVRLAEAVNGGLAQVPPHATVNALVGVPAEKEPLLRSIVTMVSFPPELTSSGSGSPP